MNDLRSRNRTLAPVPPLGPRTGEIVAPVRKPRSSGSPLFESSRRAPEPAHDPADGGDADREGSDPLTFQVSRQLRTMPVSATNPGGPTEARADEGQLDLDLDDGHPEDQNEAGPGPKRAPASRPTKRREVNGDDDVSDDKFPWHYQFDDDEPRELQAKSPLLSRAFRSSVG